MPVLTDDDLKAISVLLEAYGLKKVVTLKRAQNAVRQQRFRDKSNAVRNARVTQRKSEKRNASRNATITQANGEEVAFIPIVGGSEFAVSKALLAELEVAYPQVDGLATLKEIRAWCVTNPTLCKTVRGVPRFINRWFAKEQNKG